MNSKYKNLFLVVIMLVSVQLTSAQTTGYVKIPEPKRTVVVEGVHVDEAGNYDTLQFRLANDAIFKAIREDAPNRTLGDGTVYLLKRNHVYIAASMIEQQFLDIHIKGEDGPGRMPLILHTNPSGGQGAAVIRSHQNCYLENFEYDAANPDGNFGNRSIDLRGPDTRAIVKGCRFIGDRGGGLTIEGAGLRSKLYVYDCMIGNGGHHVSQGGNGRALDIRLPGGGILDSVVFKNNTIYNLTDRVIRSMGEITNYMEMDHNTIINNQGEHGCIQLGNAIEAVITNNLFVNPLTKGNRKHTLMGADGQPRTTRGEQSHQPTDKDIPDASFAIVAHNGTLGRLTQAEIIGITMRNNNIFFEQEFLDLFAAHTEVFDTPTVRAASDAVLANLTGDPSKVSFTEKLSFDYNDMEAGNLGTVSSYKDLVEVNKVFIADPGAAIYPENWSILYPHEWNASYSTSTTSYTAADGGYPLGDLNWFPEDKAKWMANPTAKASVKAVEIPVGIEINQVYPNPFGVETKIDYSLLVSQNVEIVVYNVNGQKVKTLLNGYMQQGEYEVVWNGTDNNGNVQISGIYFVVISGPSGRVSEKLVKIW